MRIYKRYVALFTLVILCVSSLFNYTTASAAEKLGKKDFVFTGNDFEGKYDFLQDIDELGYTGENGWALNFHAYNKDADKSKKGCIKTSRGIVLGSTMKSVTKAYGDKKAIKVDKDEKIYKCLMDQSVDFLTKTLKASDTYIDYTYTYTDSYKYKNKVAIRYYFDKDDKVSIIVLLNNLKFIPY